MDGLAHNRLPKIDVNAGFYSILGGGTVAKLLLWQLCCHARPTTDSLRALAEDHLNDVVSNVAAIVTAVVAAKVHHVWWIDPVGAILISLWIVSRWTVMTFEQTGKIVGKSAPQEFIDDIESLAREHHPALDLDCTRAYHFGARYAVEMEIVLPATMFVSESHDIALALQHKLEALEIVERANVHVDYVKRSLPEHKVERTMLQSADTAPLLILGLGNTVPRGGAQVRGHHQGISNTAT